MFGFGGPTLFPRHVAKRDERVATNRIEVEPAGFLDDVFELLAGFAELPQSDVSSCSSQAQPERSRVIILGYERECARVEAVCLAQPFTVLGLFASLAQRLDRAGNGRRHLRPADLTGDQAEHREGLREAHRFYSRALALVPEDDHAAALGLHLRAARAYVGLGQLGEAGKE